ncbi:hypothetical protein [Inquilinus sp. OTU3971]|uniref:hypothetical protein n=1 Tax=Inquilinus sp. OTU3971 TaxID=3043855 RepID=UPI00313DE8A4
MITIEDCLAMSVLTEEEIELLAEHEHLPEILAIGLGNSLAHTKKGKSKIRHWIRDEIHAAQQNGDRLRVAKLKLVLRHFCECHPDAHHHAGGGTEAAPGP